MLESHAIHQNMGFWGCSIEIFTLESWIIVIFIIGHVNSKTRERQYARDRRKILVIPHTNTNTNATCEERFSLLQGEIVVVTRKPVQKLARRTTKM